MLQRRLVRETPVLSLLEMYEGRAADCRREAGDTGLVNVRERCLRAALAFEEMADALRVHGEYRVREDARKAEQGNVSR